MDDCLSNFAERQLVALAGWTRRFMSVLLLSAVLGVIGQAHAQSSIIHHRYNEGSGTSAGDSSGNGNSATIHGATWVTGQTGSALGFDGVDDYAVVPGSALAGISTGLTISTWIYLPSLPGEGWYGIATRQKGSTADEHFFLGMFGNGPHFFVETTNGGSYWEPLPDLTANTWHHLVGTYDGEYLKLYVDGDLQFSTPHTGAIAADTTPLEIGSNTNYSEAPGANFPGRIDNLRVYLRALTAAEIAGLASEDGGTDSTPPTVPANLSGVATSSSQIDLSWTASSDNVGVTSYLIERCQGSSCSNFTQIATATTTSYSNTGLSASTTYRYRIRATDAAGNASGYSSSASATTPASSSLTTGLWLHHRYNESTGSSASDASGKGHVATLFGDPTWIQGQTANALSLDGTDDYGLVTTEDLNQISTALTISAWVYLPAEPQHWWSGIASRQLGSTWGEHYYLGLAGTAARFFVSTTNGNSSNETGVELTTGAWHHLVGVYDGSTVKLYVDGTLGFSNAHSGTIESDTTPLVIGGNANVEDPPGELLSGRLDNLRIYTRAVSAEEVSLLASEDNGGDVSPPTPPTALTLTPGATQMQLSWTASSDNVGVTSYLIERCQGASCSNFTQIASASGTSYANTGLTPDTSYNYRLRAKDAAGNLSSYSSIASATTDPATMSAQGPLAVIYEYDGAGRLRAATYDSIAKGYTLDAAGNRTLVATAALAGVPSSITVPATSNTGSYTISWGAAGGTVSAYQLWEATNPDFDSATQVYNGTELSTALSGKSAGTYYYRVRACNGAACSTYRVATNSIVVSDGEAPTAPTGLSATAASPTQVNLNWNASTDSGGSGLAGYRVERCVTSSCSYAQIGAPTSNSYTDSTASGATAYSYRVRAVDGASNFSDYSNVANVTTTDNIAPSVPAGLSATAASSTQVNLSWTASTDSGGSGLAGYRVERCMTSSCSYAQIGTPTSNSYTDSTVSGAITYSYRVRAVDGANNFSGYSSIANVSVPDTIAPSTPANLSATAVSSTQVNLSWTASTDSGGSGLAGYRVERCVTNSCNYAQIGTPTSNSYTDSTASGGTAYDYRVRAVDGANNLSGYSNVANATTGPAGSDTLTLTVGWAYSTPNGDAILLGYQASFLPENPAFGAINFATNTSGYTYLSIADIYGWSNTEFGDGYYASGSSLAFYVPSGVNPGQSYLTSITVGSVTKTGASASYYWDAVNKVATWYMPGIFTITGSQLNVSVVHQ